MDARSPLDELELAAGLGRLYSLMRSLSLPRDLSMTTVSTLATLERRGPCRVTELAALEGVTQPAMTQLVSRLEREGLAERRALAGDRRVVAVHLTDGGRADLARRRAGQAKRLAELLAGLPASDRAAIAAALPALDRLAGAALGVPEPPASGECE
ncbi:MarR family winged helix-turn-helix transcriptional regulator [Actinomadura montaniterrae]|uniref:MarR family transcriptional regulator n=1 Tax=Actinomadura montaniterrae TaxID=1803903 RepID=A0A6L3VYL4_9ACTN|nr:MarR family transcriptional regulator [Actinomadura montaniterrae]KAB2377521.1 MarR family transcriptional regulator [Actinomadura montaniterrae]